LKFSNSAYHSNFINVTAFLGGIMFASMVLLIQIRNDLDYAIPLITGTGMVGMFFIFSTLGRLTVASGEKISKKHEDMINRFDYLGIFGLMIIIPLIVAHVSIEGAIVLGIVEAVSFFAWDYAVRKDS